jgi:hypothetical protein
MKTHSIILTTVWVFELWEDIFAEKVVNIFNSFFKYIFKEPSF